MILISIIIRYAWKWLELTNLLLQRERLLVDHNFKFIPLTPFRQSYPLLYSEWKAYFFVGLSPTALTSRSTVEHKQYQLQTILCVMMLVAWGLIVHISPDKLEKSVALILWDAITFVSPTGQESLLGNNVLLPWPQISWNDKESRGGWDYMDSLGLK